MNNESEEKQVNYLPYYNKGLSDEEIEFLIEVFGMYKE